MRKQQKASADSTQSPLKRTPWGLSWHMDALLSLVIHKLEPMNNLKISISISFVPKIINVMFGCDIMNFLIIYKISWIEEILNQRNKLIGILKEQ